MRKSLHIVLATSLLFLFHQNLSAYDFEVDGIYYNITSNSDLTVSVTKNNNTYSGNLIIPNTVCHSGKAYLVTSIEDETFRECSDLTNITLPIGLRSIGYGAFEECKGITNISLPNELLSIGDRAFVGCSNLKKVTIGNNAKSIGEYTFMGCTSLEEINLPNSITHIGHDAFFRCSNLKSIILPDSLKKIESCTFYECANLSELVLPNGLEVIGEESISFCTSLTSITIPNSVKELRLRAFSGCTNLTNVTLSENLQSIGDEAFYCCEKLHSIHIPDKVTKIGYAAFCDCYLMTDYNIPNNIQIIGSYAFAGCSTDRYSIIIPSSLKSIGESPFSQPTFIGDPRLKVYNMSSTIIAEPTGDHTYVYVYNNCRKEGDFIVSTKNDSSFVCGYIGTKRKTVLPNVDAIAQHAFLDCNLTSVTIPQSIKYIGQEAFCDCQITTITDLATSPQDIDNYAFYREYEYNYGQSYRFEKIYVPIGCKSNYENAPGWQVYKEIIEIEEGTTIKDGQVFDNEETEICERLNYYRTFSNTNWQAFYIPFSIPIDTLDRYGLQVAELNDTHQWDLNGDGTADSTRLEFFTLTSGSTVANFPYLIRAKEATSFSLKMNDIEVKEAEDCSFECSSIKQKFTFVGTYAGVSGTNMYNNNYYGMSEGGLKRVSNSSVSLKPQRWYLKIENKNGSPVDYYAPSIRFTVDGIYEEEVASGIVDMCVNAEKIDKEFYTLEGIQKTSSPSQRGMYVRQSKKIIIR